MIKKITLKKVRSYGSDQASLETDKRINLVYGLNGSGKTTLSDYLKYPNSPEFEDCAIEGFDSENQKILVYNQEFIKETFYESDTQKGIFTVAKDNKKAMENIKQAEKEKEKLQKKLDDEDEGWQKKLQDKEDEISKNLSDTQDEIWEIKDKYTGGDRIFDTAGFFAGLKGSKENLFNHLQDLSFQETQRNIASIENELGELVGDVNKREDISPININFFQIENDEIFQKEIVGNENSTVAELITKLENSDWVKQGIDNYVVLEQRKNCPFCQKEILTEDLVNNIKNYFDESYEIDIKTLNSHYENYKSLKASLQKDNYIKDFFNESQKLSIEKEFNRLIQTLDANIAQIGKKIEKPSNEINLSSSSEYIKNINGYIEEVNKGIEDFNHKIENKENGKSKLKEEFWKVIRKDYDLIIKHCNEQGERLCQKKNEIEKEIKNVKELINEKEADIQKNQSMTTNVDEVIEQIKRHLLDFGIHDFRIEKYGEREYQIRRNGKHENEFKSLSEGEKTVISFLYFVELCKGKETEIDTKEKIVVIDDPISSLSHMFVFNVGQLIKDVFLKKERDFLQIFVLTHNLYFFNELADRKERSNDNQKLFRISKSEHSTIQEMKRDEIQNDYQAYWVIIKNADENTMVVVANVMRNIIEYFFGFIDKSQSINNIFQKRELSDNKYRAFKRYIDRESHSDPINVSDYKDFDHTTFMEAFQRVFKATGYEKHYDQMMK